MSNIHSILDNDQIHVAKNFSIANNGDAMWRDERALQSWDKRNILPSALELVASNAAPPTEVDGDIYLIDSTLGTLTINETIFVSGNTIRITFTGSPNLSGFTVGHYLVVSGCANDVNNGSFIITSVNDPGDYIQITNTLITDATYNESGSGTAQSTHTNWDGCPYNSWVRYNEVDDRWYYIETAKPQICYIEDVDMYYYHNGTEWQPMTSLFSVTSDTLEDVLGNGLATGAYNIEFTTLTASTVPYLDANKKLASSSVTPTELNYLSGVTSSIQTQLNSLQTGMFWKAAVRVATTANGTLATDFENGDTVDGVTLATGDRILIKDQSTATQNGIYVVNTSGAPTRATDFDAGADNLAGATVSVQEGTVNAEKKFTCSTNNPITIGATNITFVDAGGTTYVGTSNRISVSGNQIDIDAAYVGQASITTLGTISTGTWQGTAIAYNYIASMTSAQLAGIVSDETGYSSGAVAVFNISPTLITDYTVSSTTATTNATVVLQTHKINSSGTAAAGFGIKHEYYAETDTTNDTLLGSQEWYWVAATHASRRAGWKLNLRSNTGESLSTPLELNFNGNGHELILRNQSGYDPRMAWYVGNTGMAYISASGSSMDLYHGNNGEVTIRGGTWATPVQFDSGGVYIGGLVAASAALHIVKTTEQLRVGYSASIYESTTVAATTGIVTRAITGGTTPYFKFNNCISINTTTTNKGLTVKEFSSGSGDYVLNVLDYSDNVLMGVAENTLDMLSAGGIVQMGGSFAFVSDSNGIELTANTDNLDIGAVSAVLLYCSSPYNLTGIVSSINGIVEGAVLFITNIGGSATITLKNNVTSSANNRFDFSSGSDITLAINETIQLVWVNGKWRDIK